MTTLNPRQRGQATVAAVVLIAGVAYLSLNFSILPLFIVGIPGLLAYLLWYATGRRRPLDPAMILPAFLLTAAGFTVHAVEEYLGHYGPAIGRLFGFAWTDQAFVVIILCLVAALSLVVIGLYRQVPIAGFVLLPRHVHRGAARDSGRVRAISELDHPSVSCEACVEPSRRAACARRCRQTANATAMISASPLHITTWVDLGGPKESSMRSIATCRPEHLHLSQVDPRGSAHGQWL